MAMRCDSRRGRPQRLIRAPGDRDLPGLALAVFDLRKKLVVQRFSTFGNVFSVKFLKNGTEFATLSKSHAPSPILQFWDVKSGKELKSIDTGWKPAQNATPESAAVASSLWRVFERYEGTPYQYGGMSDSGFDCSGFIATAFDEALGRQLPRTTSQMLATGKTVPPDQLQAGDER